MCFRACLKFASQVQVRVQREVGMVWGHILTLVLMSSSRCYCLITWEEMASVPKRTPNRFRISACCHDGW